ncbi:MAG: hypothetical protein AAF652_10985 [Cyanobacteria bacterium P01_C01_bin.72]
MKRILPIQKWQIVQWSTAIIGIALVFILLLNGLNEASWRIAIRFTARTSCILFLLAFTASSFRRIKSTSFSNWLITNHRYLGLSIAISHGYHAIAIAAVAILTSENMVRDNHGANLGYVFIILMTITSFEPPATLLGRRSWKILHTVGMYYLWLSFTVAFSERISESWLLYFPFMASLIIGLILRFIPLKRRLKTIN